MKPEDTARWVFNRIADVYAARPAYPAALIDALSALAPPGGTVGDLGAGTGNVAVPLAARGFDVIAVEPAEAMLTRLVEIARERAVPVRPLHAAAEALPLEKESLHLAVIADALHFMDVERVAEELLRVLVRRGRLAVVTVELGATPYMREIARIVESASQRRPRSTSASIAQLSALARVPLRSVRVFHDDTEMTQEALERVLRTLSFVGPAMNDQRFADLRRRILALDARPVWSRTFTLHEGRKTPRAGAT